MPDRRDPSHPSFENEQLVMANKILLGKTPPDWNVGGHNNFAYAHNTLTVGDIHRVWSDRIFMAYSAPGFVVKDAQLAFTIHKWLPLWHPSILSSPPAFEVVVLFRYPTDFVAAMMEGCDKWWPEIPKHPDYFLDLWVKYYEAIIAADNGTFRYMHSPDHFLAAPGIKRLNQIIGAELKPFPTGQIRHLGRRDKATLPKETWALYDRLHWKTMREEATA